MGGKLAMLLDAKVEETSKVNGFVGSLRLALNNSECARMVFVPNVLGAEAAPFGFNGFHGVGDSRPYVPGGHP